MKTFKIIFPAIVLFAAACFLINKKTEGNSSINYNTYNDTLARELKREAPFLVGAAVDPKKLYFDSAYAAIVAGQFNSLSTENALKWATVQPGESTFNFNKGDSIVAFAEKNKMRVHGHVLVTVSENSLPQWVINFNGDNNAWENLFKNHIQSVVQHYKGKVTSWDVVNETFDDKGNVRNVAQNAHDENIWLKHIGNDYTAKAFQYAHEADPNALLFYNDNKQETSAKKLAAIINMANDFKKRGIPINGLGIQMHINIHTPNSGIINALQQLASTGLLIHLSELDIRINPNDQILTDSAAAMKAQADKFYFVAHAYKTIIPAAQQYGITFWNVTDKDSWITLSKHAKDSPLLFDKAYKKKAAFGAFAAGLKD